MSGNNIVADTSLLINFFNGYDVSKRVLEEKQIWVSWITEIELLSFNSLSKEESRLIRNFLDECVVMDLSKTIRERAIQIWIDHKLKVPDSIIAGTSVHLDFPLVTMDNDFKEVTDLEAIILDYWSIHW